MSTKKVFEIAFQLGASITSSMRTAFANANRNLNNVNRNNENIQKSSQIASKSLNVMKGSLVAVAAGAVSVATGLGLVLNASDEFNNSMRQIQASTGMSAQKMAEIKKISKDLYNKNLGQDWEDLADAVSKAQSVTQLSGKALQDATANAIIYRDVWGEDIAESIKASDTMMKNFGITSTQAYNLLAQGAQKGLNKSGELLDTANEYSPYFKSLGFSANEMFNTFSAGLKAGAFNLDKVGDAVKEFNIRAKDGSKTTAAGFKAIGMDANKMGQIFARGGPEAQKSFVKVVQAISKIRDPVQKSIASVNLFGTQAEDLEKNVISAMGNTRKQFDMTKNTMKEVQKVKFGSLSMAIRGIYRQFETGFLIPIGDKVLPIMQKLYNSIDHNMPSIQKVVSGSLKKISDLFSGVGSVVQILTPTFQSMSKYVMSAFILVGNAFNQKVIPVIQSFAIKVVPAFLSFAKVIGQNLIPTIQSLYKSAMPVISKIIGLVMTGFGKVFSFFSQNSSKIASGVSSILKVIGAIGKGLITVFQAILPIVMPIIKDLVNFALGVWGQLVAFWNENGQQIVQAVQNVFGLIAKVIKFLAPVIGFILGSIMENVKGVIQGALNIIMGLIKIFAGLFTGDFHKMWQGIKQLFMGSIQFIWNAINLLFVGKILGGIKALGTGAISKVGLMWKAIKEFFSKGSEHAWNTVASLGPKIRNGFTAAKNAAVSLARSMWTGVKNQFNNIVHGAETLPGKIGNAIKSMGGKALDGAISMGNKLMRGMGKVVNGVIKGLNWVMAKVGIDVAINEWDVPQYAKGTKGHPGGLAILGDGGGPELYRTPKGQMGLSPGKSTLMNLPKGTHVIPAKESASILSNMNIPAYKTGNVVGNALKTGYSWLKSAGEKTMGAVKNGANKVKATALNVFDYLSNPSELLNKVLGKFGVNVPSLSGSFGDIAKGSFSLIKNSALKYLKNKLPKYSSDGGSSAPGTVQKWITEAISLTGVSPSWLGPLVQMAMKESSGNPKAINLWDSNAKAGHPSKGLMQTIDSTFNAYKIKGHDDIWNPVDNAIASIRYILSRYGSVFNTPGMKSMAKKGGYKGYFKGGKVPNTQWSLVGERGPELLKLPGGSNVFSNDKSKNMMSGLLSYGQNANQMNSQKVSSGGVSIQVDFNPQIVIEGDGDQKTILNALRSASGELKTMLIQLLKEIQEDKDRVSYS